MQFSSQHPNGLWGFNSDLDSVTLDRRDDDYDVSGNPDLFSDLSGKNQHQFILLGRPRGTLESCPNTLVLSKGIRISLFDIRFNRIDQHSGRNRTMQYRETAYQENEPVIHNFVLDRW